MKSILQVKQILGRAMIFWVCLFVIILASLWGGLFITQHNDKQVLLQQQLESTRLLYTSNLAKKLNLIVSSSEFRSYLQAGEQSRKLLSIRILGDILNLRDNSIVGIKLSDNTSPYLRGIVSQKKGVILKDGDASGPYHITLKLCYLNNRLNAKYGLCNNDLSVYFSKPALIKTLQGINPNIVPCQSKHCPNIDLIAPTRPGFFGVFPVKTTSPMWVALRVSSKSSDLLYFVLGVSILLFFALILLTRFQTRRIVNRAFAEPIDTMARALKSGDVPQGEGYIEELAYLVQRFKEYYADRDKVEVAKVAEQAAHDIRSPLVAMETLLKHLKEDLPESKFIIIRNALMQIHDIANNLVHHKTKLQQRSLNERNTIMLLPIIQYVISEKRSEFSQHGDLFKSDTKAAFAGSFVSANPTDLKRVLSNIINNAVQALPEDEPDNQIAICGYVERGVVYIKISDNGFGILPDKLPTVFDEGVTTKEKGSGLGLYHAKKTINSWGGEIAIASTSQVGTDVLIKLPLQVPPVWFARHLALTKASKIVIIDDSRSIYNIWRERFAHEGQDGREFLYFDSAERFLAWYEAEKTVLFDDTVFLIDFEFPEKLTGLDIIEKMDYRHQKYLVTSRGEEFSTTPRYIAACVEYQFTVIPKFYCHQVPFLLIEQPDMILVEPDQLLGRVWQLQAKKQSKKIRIYQNQADFILDLRLYDRQMTIYLAIEFIELWEALQRSGFEKIVLLTHEEINHPGVQVARKSCPLDS